MGSVAIRRKIALTVTINLKYSIGERKYCFPLFNVKNKE